MEAWEEGTDAEDVGLAEEREEGTGCEDAA